MEFLNSSERKAEAKLKHTEIEQLLTILAQKGVITENDAKKIRPNFRAK